MRKLTTRKYDIAERLKTPEEMALYLDACIAEGDAALPRRWAISRAPRA